VEVRQAVRAAFALDRRGLARHWRDYASEFAGYMAVVAVGFGIVGLIFGMGV
jgi:hypothetical protein